jgi:hypothetical protein
MIGRICSLEIWSLSWFNYSKLWEVVKLYSESEKAPSLPAKLENFHNRGCEKAQILQILGAQDSCRLYYAWISQSWSLTTVWQYLLGLRAL